MAEHTLEMCNIRIKWCKTKQASNVEHCSHERQRLFPNPDCVPSRRWIERYNSKLREKAKKEETRRLKQFVEAAYSLDPRMVRRRAEEKAQRWEPPAICATVNCKPLWAWDIQGSVPRFSKSAQPGGCLAVVDRCASSPGIFVWCIISLSSKSFVDGR